MSDTVMTASLDKRQDTIGCEFLTFYFAYLYVFVDIVKMEQIGKLVLSKIA